MKADGLDQIVDYLEFLHRLARVCRYFGAAPILWHDPFVSYDQAENIELAYQLSISGAVDHVPGSVRSCPSDDADRLLYETHSGSTCSVDFHGTLPVSFGDDVIAEIPILQSVDRMTLTVSESGEALMSPVPDAKGTMSLPGWRPTDKVWSGQSSGGTELQGG